MRSRPEEVAWAAGIFEGEGCITKCGRSVQLRVKMTDCDVIDHLTIVFPQGRRYEEGRDHLGQKRCYLWCVSKRYDVAVVLSELLPWLGPRRRERAAELMGGQLAVPA